MLDVGAGTGRVTLDLARRGHEVVALDREPAFLAALRSRAADLPVESVVADASGFDLGGRRFGLIIAPMQTIQLLGARGRSGFLEVGPQAPQAGRARGVRAGVGHGTVRRAAASCCRCPTSTSSTVRATTASRSRCATSAAGWRSSGSRTIVTASGERWSCEDVIHLDKIDAAVVEREARRVGLVAAGTRVIDPTDEHEGTTVVMLRG